MFTKPEANNRFRIIVLVSFSDMNSTNYRMMDENIKLKTLNQTLICHSLGAITKDTEYASNL